MHKTYRSIEYKQSPHRHTEEYINYHRKMARKNDLLKKYNLTLQEYDNLFKSQNGKCAICNTPKNTYDILYRVFL